MRRSALKELWEQLQRPKDKFSLSHMLFLCSVFEKNTAVNATNQIILVEALRQLSELILWGDQRDDSHYFDIFLEKNVFATLMQIVRQQAFVAVKIQLLQTLSILIQNLKSEMALFFLLSNNNINELIQHEWDTNNEDVMSNYVSFLKTISLKLNSRTIQFFFNGMKNDFPLYTEAIKFFSKPEPMVRTAVKTLTLNVYKVDDAAMRKFVLEQTAAGYFADVITFIGVQCNKLEEFFTAPLTPHLKGKIQDTTDELMDLFFYVHDVLSLNIEPFNRILTFHLIEYLLLPVFLRNLEPDKDSMSPPLPIKMKATTALYIITQMVTIFTHAPLVNSLGAYLVHPFPHTYKSLYMLSPPLASLKQLPKYFFTPEELTEISLQNKIAIPKDSSAIHSSGNRVGSVERRELAPSSPLDLIYSSVVKAPPKKDVPTKPTYEDRLPREYGSYRERLLEFLKEDDDKVILGTLCLLYGILRNNSFERQLLSESGVFPYRLTKAKNLLESLTSLTSSPSLSAKSTLFGDSTGSGIFDDSDAPSQSLGEKYTNDVVAALLDIFCRTEKYRIVTLQMTILLLKELVYCEEQQTSTNLTDDQWSLLTVSYEMSASNLRERLVSSEVGDVFLEFFEDEIKNLKPVRFEQLTTDYTLLLPIPQGISSGVQFTMRLPSDEQEETRKAIQRFLLLRNLLFLLKQQKDDLIPLKNAPVAESVSLEQNAVFQLDTEKLNQCVRCNVTSANGVGPRLLLVEGSFLLVVNPTTTTTTINDNDDGDDNDVQPSSGIIQDLLELQNIEVLLSNGDNVTLLTKVGSLSFDTEEQCVKTKVWLESSRHDVRKQKLVQLYDLLGISAEEALSIASHKGKPICSNEAKPNPNFNSKVTQETPQNSEIEDVNELDHESSSDDLTALTAGIAELEPKE